MQHYIGHGTENILIFVRQEIEAPKQIQGGANNCFKEMLLFAILYFCAIVLLPWKSVFICSVILLPWADMGWPGQSET